MAKNYKINPLTGQLQEYVFEYNGILAMRNFVARVDGERLILHHADDINFSILDALVSEVEINGVVYDTPQTAQEALTRLTFNQNHPVILPKSERILIQNALQKGTYTGTAQELKESIDDKAHANHTHSYNDLTDKPDLFSGDYNDLNNKPTLFSGNYNDLTNKPDFAVRQDITSAFAVHLQGEEVNKSNFAIKPEHIGRTLFVKRSCTLNINEIADGIASVSVKKCYAGNSPINFTFTGRMIKNGGDNLNGLEGSNAVISVVDNTCYIDICNYE